VFALDSFCSTGPTLTKSDNPLLHHRNHCICKSLGFLTGGNRFWSAFQGFFVVHGGILCPQHHGLPQGSPIWRYRLASGPCVRIHKWVSRRATGDATDLGLVVAISSALSIPFIIVAFQINLFIALWHRLTRKVLRCKFLYQPWRIFLAFGKILVKVVLIGPLLYFARRHRGRWDAESDTRNFCHGDGLSEVASTNSSSSLHRRFPEDNSWDQPAVSRFIRVPLRARGRQQRTIAFPDGYAWLRAALLRRTASDHLSDCTGSLVQKKEGLE